MDTTIPGLNVLAQLLDAAAMRHRVLAQNVANVNTPGYRRKDVQFEDEFARAMSVADGGPVPPVRPRVVIADGPERVDGNTVDLDREMNNVQKNALLYEAAAQIVASRVATLRAAVAGR
jgi:flagellar basal-body rod protein FlgB